MYHYVREYDPIFPNFRFLDINNFRKQIDYFYDEFGFVSRDEWDAYVDSGEMPNRSGKVILTFDDAMRCHFDYVYPELKARGLWALFYVPTQPFATGRMLNVHQIHLLGGAIPGPRLFEAATRLIDYHMILEEKKDEFCRKTYKTQDNYERITDFKRLLNYYLNPKYKCWVIDNLMREFGVSSEAANFYISESQIKEMAYGGMLIGSHTVSHPVMSTLPLDSQRDEIRLSLEYLESIGAAEHRTYCHPYGGFHSFNSDTVAVLNELCVRYSFNVDSREIEADDIAAGPQYLPRFDCNEFRFGKAS